MESLRATATSILRVWTYRDIACFCVTRAADHVDIIISIDGTVVQHMSFNEGRTAIDFATAKLDVYTNV